eukprot:Selendium_serpulae@DN3927_c1_g1_i1.p1
MFTAQQRNSTAALQRGKVTHRRYAFTSSANKHFNQLSLLLLLHLHQSSSSSSSSSRQPRSAVELPHSASTVVSVLRTAVLSDPPIALRTVSR